MADILQPPRFSPNTEQAMSGQMDFLSRFESQLFVGQRHRAPATEQEQELLRVEGAIANLVQQFFDGLEVGKQFCMSDLTRFVQDYHQCAPDSPGRVARQMKKTGQVQYEVVCRAHSKYRKTGEGK